MEGLICFRTVFDKTGHFCFCFPTLFRLVLEFSSEFFSGFFFFYVLRVYVKIKVSYEELFFALSKEVWNRNLVFCFQCLQNKLNSDPMRWF